MSIKLNSELSASDRALLNSCHCERRAGLFLKLISIHFLSYLHPCLWNSPSHRPSKEKFISQSLRRMIAMSSIYYYRNQFAEEMADGLNDMICVLKRFTVINHCPVKRQDTVKFRLLTLRFTTSPRLQAPSLVIPASLCIPKNISWL